MKESKFTISCESIVYPGFITEKITDAFCANSLPIYYGSSYVKKEFNPDAFIYLGDYSTLEEGIEKVIEIDRDDEKYISMLMQPKFISEDYYDTMVQGLRTFLFSIFDQNKDEARRRLGFYVQKHHEQHLSEYGQIFGTPEYKEWKLRSRIKRKIRKMKHRA